MKNIMVPAKSELDVVALCTSYRDLCDSIPAGYFTFNPHGTILSVNHMGTQMLGRDLAHLLNKPFLAFVVRHDWHIFQAHLGNVFANDVPQTCEIRLKRTGSSSLPVELRSAVVENSAGMDRYCRTLAYDIYERKEIQVLAKWLDIFNSTQIGIAVVSADGKTLEMMNPAFAAMHGYSVGELTGKPVLDVSALSEKSKPPSYEHIAKIKGFHTYETLHIRKDGSVFPVEIMVTVVRNEGKKIRYRIINVQDITARMKIESEFKHLSHKYELILEFAGDGIFGLDVKGNNTFVNQAASAMLGYEKNELIGKHSHTLYHHSRPDGTPYPIEECPIYAAYRDGTLHFGEEVFWRRDGMPLPVEFTSRPLFEQNNIVGAVVTFKDITRRKEGEERIGHLNQVLEQRNAELNAERARWQGVVESIADEVWVSNIDGEMSLINFSAIAPMGLEEFKGKTIGEVLEGVDILDPEERPRPLENAPLLQSLRGEIVRGEEIIRHRGTGRLRYRQFSSAPMRDAAGSITGAVAIVRDITEQKLMEGLLRKSKEFSDALNSINTLIHSTLNLETILGKALGEAARTIEMDGASIGIFQDETLVIRHTHNMPQEMINYHFSPSELKGIRDVLLSHEAVIINDVIQNEQLDIPAWRRFGIRTLLVAPLVMQENITGVLSFYSFTSSRVLTDLYTDFLRKLSASLSFALENAMLYDERRQVEEAMTHLAHHDALTGLANRLLLRDIVALELARSRRNQKKAAVLFLDLDRFKEVNDTLGHEAGDDLLKEVAQRLKTSIRASDAVARIGGDEFSIILANVTHPEDISAVVQEILNSFKKPYLISGHYLHITTSIGISIYPDDNREIDTLFRYADIAMYDAKGQGGNTFRFYSHDINIRTLERMKMEGYLRHTIERGELTVYYQPQIDIKTSSIFCAEALIRWNHPEMGLLMPKHFIPLAEETGFVATIDEWLLKTVCMQRKLWMDRGMRNLCVTVNVSARQFQNPELAGRILCILEETGLPPESLILEITESMAMSNVEHTAERLQELIKKGIRFSIDDFGTGYSSLSYLKRLPVYQLKIDQSFVQDLTTDPDNRAIIKAVITMAHGLNMRVIAEGVETEDQLAFLRSIDCDEAQGFLFSKPLTADEFEALIAVSAGSSGSSGTACDGRRAHGRK